MDRGSRIKEEITGVLAILAGLIVFISLISHNPWDQSFSTSSHELKNLLGSSGAYLSDFLMQAIGYASYIIPAIFFVYGFQKVMGRHSHCRKTVFAIALIVLILSMTSVLSLMFGTHAGGAAGIFSTDITRKVTSKTGSYLLFFSCILVSLMYLFQFSVVSIATSLRKKMSYGSQAMMAMRRRKKRK